LLEDQYSYKSNKFARAKSENRYSKNMSLGMNKAHSYSKDINELTSPERQGENLKKLESYK